MNGGFFYFRYFTNELGTEDRETKLWYHRKLANYFEQQKHNISRVIEVDSLTKYELNSLTK